MGSHMISSTSYLLTREIVEMTWTMWRVFEELVEQWNKAWCNKRRSLRRITLQVLKRPRRTEIIRKRETKGKTNPRIVDQKRSLAPTNQRKRTRPRMKYLPTWARGRPCTGLPLRMSKLNIKWIRVLPVAKSTSDGDSAENQLCCDPLKTHSQNPRMTIQRGSHWPEKHLGVNRRLRTLRLGQDMS